MNSYINYDYYTETFKGTLIPQEKFERFAIRASNKVRNNILNRPIDDFETEVKNATCSIVDILYNQYLNQEKLKNIITGKEKVISSEKVGDWSRNISNVSIEDLKKLSSNEYNNELIETTLEDYLLVTGLLYLGVPYVR